MLKYPVVKFLCHVTSFLILPTMMMIMIVIIITIIIIVTNRDYRYISE